MEIMTPLIQRADAFAAAAHASIDQRRKYTGEPYIVHPRAVAATVASIGASDVLIAAALLHDVVEDTPVSLDEIRREFGLDVARYVDEVTDRSRPEDGNRAVRRRIDREHLAGASPGGQTIKLADLIDNTSSITGHDPHFAKTYMAEKALLLPFLTRGHPALFDRAQALLTAWEEAQLQAALQVGLRTR